MSSMNETQNPPKVFVNKPKKGLHPPGAEKGEPVPRVAVQQPTASAPLQPPFWYRYRAAVGALLLVNIGIGGYVLSRPKPVLEASKKEAKVVPEPEKEKSTAEQVPVPVVATTVAAPQFTAPPKAPISEEEQRQVLQWVLEEKRKEKAQSKLEKARIDEEKRFLKQLLRETHLPPLI